MRHCLKVSRALIGAMTALLAAAALPAIRGADAAFPASNGQIAFVSDRDGNFEIYAMDTSGGGITRLTNNPAADTFPAWSPDGSRIAFESTRDAGRQQIYLMDPNGGGQTRISALGANNTQPAWSPDGTKLAFVSDRDGNPEIYVMSADGSGVTRLTNNSAHDSDPSWSPDGTRLAFATDRDGQYEIYSMAPDGSGQTNLTNSTAPLANERNPDWSPDGSRIAYWNSSGLSVMNADGSGQTVIAAGLAEHDPSWSPDGSRIAFTSFRDIDVEIYTVAPDGSSPTRLTTRLGFDDEASWGPPARAGGGALPAPVLGKTVNVEVVRGIVLIKRPGDKAFTRLSGGAQIPVGSLIDTTHGTVRLTSARDAHGKNQAGLFYSGRFQVLQKVVAAPVTELDLKGRHFRACGRTAKSATIAKRARVVRKLWGNATGRFRTRGSFASATVRGTRWLTADRCDGTFISVRKGSVLVRDLRLRRNFVVRAGHSYLARAR